MVGYVREFPKRFVGVTNAFLFGSIIPIGWNRVWFWLMSGCCWFESGTTVVWLVWSCVLVGSVGECICWFTLVVVAVVYWYWSNEVMTVWARSMVVTLGGVIGFVIWSGRGRKKFICWMWFEFSTVSPIEIRAKCLLPYRFVKSVKKPTASR